MQISLVLLLSYLGLLMPIQGVDLPSKGYTHLPETVSSEISMEKKFKTSVQELEQAVLAEDYEKVQQLREKLKKWVDRDRFSTEAHYFIGYADYRINTTFAKYNDGPKKPVIEEGIHHLREARKDDQLEAEALALLSSFYGMKINGPVSVWKYGPKANECIEKALELAPNNPRVLLVDGIGKYYKPSIAGGGMKKAQGTLEKAVQLFENDKAISPSYLDWGRAEAYAWLGKIYMESGQWNKAGKMISKADDISEGSYKWVEEELIPALQNQNVETEAR